MGDMGCPQCLEPIKIPKVDWIKLRWLARLMADPFPKYLSGMGSLVR